ncbi:hypothetical protein [Sulfitobacter sp. SH24]|uniref:hypothetical protein n=1 Tax=Sulfitobacter sp. SH24 TaxID=3421173 RepID=UPI003F4F604C
MDQLFPFPISGLSAQPAIETALEMQLPCSSLLDNALEASASLGNAAANTALAWLFGAQHCHYFQNNPPLVTKLYKRAAEQGYPVAMTSYGIKLLRGEGTANNPYTGTAYLLNAAISGWDDAGLFLAEHIFLGINAKYGLDVAQLFYAEFRHNAHNEELIESVENLLAKH